MDARGEGDDSGVDRQDLVVVPHRPGPLVSLDRRPGARRERDDLDDLIDELVPEVDEGPGWFDAALLAAGGGLLAWAALGDVSGTAVVAGVAALALGAVLPVRTAWRRVRRGRDARRRAALLGRGVPLDITSSRVADLVGSYRDLVDLAGRLSPELATPAISAAHGTLSEVATLLGGRVPASDREAGYVDVRAVAVADLVAALRALTAGPAAGPASPDDGPAVSPEAVLRAREEIDEIAASSSVTRLDDLTADLRDQGHGRER